MQYLPDIYSKKILGREPKRMPAGVRKDIQEHLKSFGLDLDTKTEDAVLLPIPDTFGDLQTELAEATHRYGQIIDRVSTLAAIDLAQLPTPDHFSFAPGWHVWHKGQWSPMAQPPSDRTMIYDIETVEVNGKWLPTCAVALTTEGLAAWVTDFTDMPSVIPMGTDNDIVGWNIGYDRQYSSSDYTLGAVNNYIDMMSMWVVSAGMSNQQAVAWKASKKEDKVFSPLWVDDTSTNSLAEVYKHFFNNSIDKGVRDNIVKDGLPWVSDHMSLVLKYCYEDVVHTAELLAPLLPMWLVRRPSAVNRAGLVMMGNCKLPLSPTRFPAFYKKVEAVKKSTLALTQDMLWEHAQEFKAAVDLDNMTEQQKCLDWTPALSGKNKGEPLWWREMLAAYKKDKLTLTQRDVVLVLELTYLGAPILWRWDEADKDKSDRAKGGWYTKNHGYLPHPEERGAKLTSIFVKGYVAMIEDGVIAGKDSVKELIAKKVSLINWISIRKRVSDIKVETNGDYPLCLPPLVPSGTVTGRSKDGCGSVWLVAPNPKPWRIGTELKSMIEAPAGYTLLGADVASEEAWLAGIFGDSLLGYCGSTPLGLSNIIGTKGEKTDIHSIMSKVVAGKRDQAKTLVYAGIYGQGLKGCTDYLLRANPTWTIDQAKTVATEFLNGFKGSKQWGMGYFNGLASEAFNYMESLADSAQPKTPLCGAWMSQSIAGIQDFKPTRVNWTCQASGVDFRDMLLVLIENFAKKLNVSMMLVIAIHDEVRYLVPKGAETIACYVLQLAHLYTRFAFIDALGLDNLPAGVAWFPEIDIDFVLRKDPLDPQVTPTQKGLALGHIMTPCDLLNKL